MINKTIHGLIFGFYIIFALLCGMGGFVLVDMSFTMTCMIIIIILLICFGIHGFFLGKQIFAFGRNVILDVEDGHQHLQSELGNIRSVMDSFTDILDTVIDQQTSLDKKVDVLLKKPIIASESLALETQISDKTHSPQDHYYDVHKVQLQHPASFSEPVPVEEFDNKKLPDFLSETKEDKILSGFSEEFMTYPVKPSPHLQDKNGFPEKNPKPPVSRHFETERDMLAEEEFADVTDMMQNTTHHEALSHHNMSDIHIENEEFFEDITKMMRHNIEEKEAQSVASVASHIAEKPMNKESSIISTESVIQKPVIQKPVMSSSSLPMKHNIVDKDKQVELPSLKDLIPQEASALPHTRLAKSFIPEAVPSLESLIKQDNIPSVKNTPDIKTSLQSNISSPSASTPTSQSVPQAPPVTVPQFKTQAPQAAAPVMQPAPEEEVKALPAENLSHIIRHALERNAIDTFICPVIDSLSRETCYFEAYSYLRDAQEKHHPPKYFLPQAERDGLHTTIDRILLTRSVQIVRALQNAGKKVGVFSNISVKSVTDGDFMEELLEMVREKHDLSQGVVLEFSQRQLNYMTSMRIEKMTRLSSHGFVFSLDNVERPLPDLRELTAVGFRFLKLTPQDLDKGVSIAGKLVKGNEVKRLCNELNMKLVIIHVQDHNDMLTVMNYGADFLQGDLLGGVKRLDQLDLQAP